MYLSQTFSFLQFYPKIKNSQLPFRTAYKFNKLITDVENASEFYREKIQEIIEEYGKRDESGNLLPADDKGNVQIDATRTKECNQKFNELAQIPVETSVTFTLDELEHLELTVEQVGYFEDLIIE